MSPFKDFSVSIDKPKDDLESFGHMTETEVRQCITLLSHLLIEPCTYCMTIDPKNIENDAVHCLHTLYFTDPLHWNVGYRRVSIAFCLDCGMFRNHSTAHSHSIVEGGLDVMS